MIERYDNPAMRQRKVAQIREQSGQILRTVNSILLLSKLDMVDSIEREPIDIEQVLTDAIKQHNRTITDRCLTVDLDLSHGRFSLQGDNALLIQAFTYIIDNAVRYSPEGGVIAIRGESLKKIMQFKVKIKLLHCRGGYSFCVRRFL